MRTDLNKKTNEPILGIWDVRLEHMSELNQSKYRPLSPHIPLGMHKNKKEKDGFLFGKNVFNLTSSEFIVNSSK